MSNPGAVSMTHGVWRTLSYDIEDFDVGGIYSDAQPTQLTAPVAGKYLVMASCRWATHASGRRVLALTKNGSEDLAQDQVSPMMNTADTTMINVEQTVTAVCQLQAGDYVVVRAYQDRGGALTLFAGTGTNWFSMVWLTP